MPKHSNASRLPGDSARALGGVLSFLVLSLTYGLSSGAPEARAATEAVIFLRECRL